MLIDNVEGSEFKYEIYLCRPYTTMNGTTPSHDIIGCLSECANDVNIKKELRNVNELSFGVNLKWNDIENSINTYFDTIREGQVILLQSYIDDTLKESEYLYIYEVDIEGGDREIKHIKCYSKHYLWNKIKLRGFQDTDALSTTRRIYTGDTFVADDPTEGGIMDYILAEKLFNTWTISDVSASIADSYRTFDISEQSLLTVVKTIEDMFNCVFIFDTFNYDIQIKAYGELPDETGLIIASENYLKNIKEQIKIDEIVTRLYATGNNDISLSGINITGQAYIDDFTYFRSLNFMTQSLLDALDAYDIVITSNQGDFDTEQTTLTAKQTELATLQNDLVNLNTTLQIYQDNEDLAIRFGTAGGENYTHWHNLSVSTEALITLKEAEITSKEAEIVIVYSDIGVIVTAVSYETNLTTAQSQELLQFINEQTIKCETDDYEELLSYTQSVLAIRATPPIEFECDISDIFSIASENYTWTKFVLGSKIDLEYENLSIQSKPRIIAYSHNLGSQKLSVTVSNKNYFNDDLSYISNIIAMTRDTTTIIDNEKEIYREYNEDKDNILTDTSTIDTSTNPLESGNGTIIDRRGIWMREAQAATGQMRILDDKIVFTNDNWDSYSTAITSDGIYCSSLWVLTNTDGSVQINDNTIEITNMELSLATDDGKNTIVINPTYGMQILQGTTPVFDIDVDGNLDITGNIVMSGGSISWDNIDSDPTIATAQSAAEDSQTDADTANGLIGDIASDSKFTAVEKIAIKKEWDSIVTEKTLNDTQADAFSVSKVAYGNAYTALSSYITPLLSDLSTTSNITGTTFRSTFKTYYDSRTNLLNAIATKAKTLADNAQTTANQIAAGTYSGGTFIDEKIISSPTILNTKVGMTDTDAAGAYTSRLDTDTRIWAGDTFNNRATAPFRVTQAGTIYATDAVIEGIITASKFYGEDTSSAYLEIGAGDSKAYADMKLFRDGKDKPVFAVFDNITEIVLRIGTGTVVPHNILYATDTTTYIDGIWDFSAATCSISGLTAVWG